ncbi:MAG: aspartate-semialdehyde dehydrogenase [Verrucomicrobia bacterium]|nr:aspartate-semialdehyde dehydrogenase [Verrucomicrobiota bacterium]MBS0637136.1 aspartate-semialdehyde dehydrogenase [Verrucomicrobiota bacterium]
MTIKDDFQDQDSREKFIQDLSSQELHQRRRVPVGVLGATGNVGQKLLMLIDKHQWFKVTAVAASEKSQGKSYKEAVEWRMPVPLSEEIGELEVMAPEPNLPCKIVFSCLDGNIAGEIEQKFAKNGYAVISCARSHRMDPKVPLFIPEVNMQHLELLKFQNFPNRGLIIAKPNCAVIGLMMALRPLQLEFGIEAVHVVTMQSISGAGFPGVPSMAIADNIIPYIANEEDRLVEEPAKIFGTIDVDHIEPYPMNISATCTRVPVTEGHLEVVSVKLKEKATLEQVKRAFKEFSSPLEELKLPSAPSYPIHYFEENDMPQPKLQRDLERGMAVSVGRLRPDSLMDYKFVLLSHNTVRGAAGGAILIAELLVKNGYIFW